MCKNYQLPDNWLLRGSKNPFYYILLSIVYWCVVIVYINFNIFRRPNGTNKFFNHSNLIIYVIKTTQTKDNFVESIDLRQQEFKL